MYHGVRTCMSVQLTRKNYSRAEEGEPGDKAKLQCPCSTVAMYHSTCMSVQLTRTNYILAHRGEPVDKVKLQCPCSTVHVATCMYHGVHVCLYNSSMYITCVQLTLPAGTGSYWYGCTWLQSEGEFVGTHLPRLLSSCCT